MTAPRRPTGDVPFVAKALVTIIAVAVTIVIVTALITLSIRMAMWALG